MTDMTPSQSRQERPKPPVRPSRPLSTVKATGTAENTVQPVRKAPVAPERQFSSRREMRLAQRASQTPAEGAGSSFVPAPYRKRKADDPLVWEDEPFMDLQDKVGSVPAGFAKRVPAEPAEPAEPGKAEEPVETVKAPDAFWQDVNDDLEDPEFRKSYGEASEEVREVDDAVAERERVRSEKATRATGFKPVVLSAEELRLMRAGREFVGVVSKDEVIGEIMMAPDAEKLDERLRVLLRRL